MESPAEIVTAFLAEWGKSRAELIGAIRKYFTDSTVFENIGIVTTTGKEEAVDLINLYADTSLLDTVQIDMLNLAEVDGKVLTERLDTLWTASGDKISEHRLMGIFEVAGDKIVAWRDYFDTRPVPEGIIAPSEALPRPGRWN